MSEDPYVYPGTDVLINFFDIREQDILSDREQRLSMYGIDDLQKRPVEGHFDLDHLKDIHKRIFEDIYPFAGEIRTIEVWKAEIALGGKSVDYASPADIESTAKAALDGIKRLRWGDMSLAQDWEPFAKLISEAWRAHPFREGNSRAFLLFVDQLVQAHGADLDMTVISQVPSETRDAFAVAASGSPATLAALFHEARQAHLGRSHSALGKLSSEAVQVLDLMGQPEVTQPSPGEAVRGSVLCTTYDTVLVHTRKGVAAVNATAFDEHPANNARVSIEVPEHQTASAPAGRDRAGPSPLVDEVRSAFRLKARIREAGHTIGRDAQSGMLTIDLSLLPDECAQFARSRPDVVHRLSAAVLKENDPGAYETWKATAANVGKAQEGPAR